jgi:hypothetical protein
VSTPDVCSVLPLVKIQDSRGKACTCGRLSRASFGRSSGTGRGGGDGGVPIGLGNGRGVCLGLSRGSSDSVSLALGVCYGGCSRACSRVSLLLSHGYLSVIFAQGSIARISDSPN